MSDDLRGIKDLESQKRVAIAYLGHHAEEAPENMRPMLLRLQRHDQSCRGMLQAVEQAKAAIREFQSKIQISTGAIQELVDISVGMLPNDPDVIKKWFDAGCDEFEKDSGEAAPSTTVVSRNPVKPSGEVDVAGSHVALNHGATSVLKP